MMPTLLAASPTSLQGPLGRALTGSSTLAQAFAASGLLSSSERALLEAGESAGRLPELLDALAHLRAQRRKTQRQLVVGLAYPALLVVLGGFLLTAPLAVTRGIGGWLSIAAWPLIVVATLAVGFLVVAPRLPRDAWLVTAPRRLAMGLPLVGAGFTRGTLAVFLDVLSHLLGAGLSIALALPAALQASGDERLITKQRDVLRAIERGATLTEALRSTNVLPDRVLSTLAVAEQSGTLERALLVLGRDEAEGYGRFVRLLVALTGAAAFVVVALAIAGTIVLGASSYLERIEAIDS